MRERELPTKAGSVILNARNEEGDTCTEMTLSPIGEEWVGMDQRGNRRWWLPWDIDAWTPAIIMPDVQPDGDPLDDMDTRPRCDKNGDLWVWDHIMYEWLCLSAYRYCPFVEEIPGVRFATTADLIKLIGEMK